MNPKESCFFKVVLLLIVLISFSAVTIALDEQGSVNELPPVSDKVATTEVQKVAPNIDSIKGASGDLVSQESGGTKTVHLPQAASATKKDGTEMKNLQDATFNKDGNLNSAKHVETSQAKADGVKDFAAKPDGSITASSADKISSEGIEVTNADNVRLDTNMLEVSKAESVAIDGLLAQNVKDARFFRDPSGVTITSKKDSPFIITDKNGNEWSYKASSPDNLVRFNKDSVILKKNVELTLHKNIPSIGPFIETINSTGLTTLTTNKNGIVCSDSSGDGYLIITFPDMNKDFAFRTLTMHLTCFRKTADQSFPYCQKGCVLVDYVDKKITINGFVDYLRHYVDDRSGWLYRTFASMNTSATAVLSLDKDFRTITDLLITNCSSCETHPNNYITLYEISNTTAVQTYVDVNPEVKSASASVLRNYTSGFSNVSLIFNEHNELVYFREFSFVKKLVGSKANSSDWYEWEQVQDNTTVVILPPGSPKIGELVGRILKTAPAWLPFPFLAGLLLFVRRKGQVSMFIIFCILFLLVLLSLAYVASQFRPVDVSLSLAQEHDAFQKHVDGCFGVSLSDVLVLVGRQGGQVPMQKPYFVPLNTSILSSAYSDEEVQSVIEERLLPAFEQCLQQYQMSEKQGFDVTQCDDVTPGRKSPFVTSLLSDASIYARLHTCYDARAGKYSTQVKTSFLSIPVPLKVLLANARAVLQQNVKVNDRAPFALQQLRGSVVLFPYYGRLITTQERDIPLSYFFVFAKA